MNARARIEPLEDTLASPSMAKESGISSSTQESKSGLFALAIEGPRAGDDSQAYGEEHGIELRTRSGLENKALAPHEIGLNSTREILSQSRPFKAPNFNGESFQGL